jgi:uncharacterized membrane protein
MQGYRTGQASVQFDRPVGISLLAIVMGILGFLALITGILLVFSTWVMIAGLGVFVSFLTSYIISVGTFGAVLLVLGGAATIAIALGLWRQESWALWVSVVGVALLEVMLFFVAYPFSYLFLGFLVLYIYLLAVRQHFR